MKTTEERKSYIQKEINRYIHINENMLKSNEKRKLYDFYFNKIEFLYKLERNIKPTLKWYVKFFSPFPIPDYEYARKIQTINNEINDIYKEIDKIVNTKLSNDITNNIDIISYDELFIDDNKIKCIMRYNKIEDEDENKKLYTYIQILPIN